MITKVILYAINITDLESHSNLNNIRIACFKTQRNVFLYIDLPHCMIQPVVSLIHIKVFPNLFHIQIWKSN